MLNDTQIETMDKLKIDKKLQINDKNTETNKTKSLIIFSRKMAEEMICSYGLFSKLYRIEKSKNDPEHKRHCYYFFSDTDVIDAFTALKKEALECRAERERIVAEGDIVNAGSVIDLS